MKVTKIKAQKNQRRVNIYLDGKFAFGLDADNLLKAELEVGQELTEKQIRDLIFKNEFQKLYDRALKFISFRPRSEKEIRDYLKKKKAASRLADEVVKKLQSLGQLDDQAFAAWWFEQRAAFRPRGKFALKAELRQKGISQAIIEKVLEQLDELSLAQKAVVKKMKAYKKLGPREFRQKMTAFLARSGFSWETIREVLLTL